MAIWLHIVYYHLYSKQKKQKVFNYILHRIVKTKQNITHIGLVIINYWRLEVKKIKNINHIYDCHM